MKLLSVILILLQWFSLDLFNCKCNKTKASEINYVKRGQFPFLAFVIIVKGNITDIIYRCSGVILSEEWMITAAHCVYDNVNETFYKFEYIQIIAGTIDLADSKSWQVHECLRTIPYKDYGNKEIGRHDFCLVQVVRPFYFSNYVNMVTFSNQNWPECRVRKNCIIISWKDNESKSPPNLQYGRTIAKRGLNACKCTRKYQIDTLICVRRHSICYGSGGSPLLCEGELVGLAHANFDKHCNNSIMTHTRIQTECNESDKYSVYTYLFAYKVWISQYIEVFDRSDQIRQYTDIYSDKFRTKHERAVNKYERSDRVIVMDHFSDQLIIYLCLMACCNISLKSTNYAACNLLLLLSIAN